MDDFSTLVGALSSTIACGERNARHDGKKDERSFHVISNVFELSDTPKGRQPGAQRTVFARTRR
jgi:hypothetical protein